MRIAVISDTHGAHADLELPDTDVLIHAGDIASHGDQHEIESFLHWFEQCDAAHRIFIAGNHDRFIESEPDKFKHLLPDNVIYLQDSGVEIDGVKFWGTPMTPRFFDWAFMADIGPELNAYWSQIPTDTDILITHGPPYGIMDGVTHNGKIELAGCPNLLKTIESIKPVYHLFGHIHEGRGRYHQSGVEFINASCMNEHYQLAHAATVIEIDAKKAS